MAGIDHYEYHQESSDKMPQREADKKKLLQLLYEYATEKCTARKGDCGDSVSDACPFNEGAQEGMRWCGMYTILHELGAEVGDMSVCDKFDELSFDNE